ncbi:hypothetical protein MMA231_02035 [Asticcacaulis sp. MM231]|uniref:Uncharacterized protein n=2 Tax=Caulobacteraceae TaxID=76892 RepID=V4RPQ2_9CAUL|nr:hypothetical protein ABENE_06510 [Asticcacaulis benevestitus DSM 16100 = ATCC BAA-896]
MTMTLPSDIRTELYEAMTANTYVRLSLPEGEHEGFIVGLSKQLVLLQAIHEWQDVGALIAPVESIEACEVSEFHDAQIRILDFNSVKRTKRYSWVKLGSYEELFKSLKFKNKFVVVSLEDDADVGQIDSIEKDSVDLKAVDPGGNWIEEALDCPYEEITLVQFDDSYSRTLQRYVERTSATLN